MAGRRGEIHNELAVMADFANPTQISEFALGLSRPDYMDAWAGYTTDPKFTYDPARLDDVRAIADRLSGARVEMRPR
jgi:homogentisate 1,2-dioxygenase